jgi:trehalose 6-phosphate phosphatase
MNGCPLPTPDPHWALFLDIDGTLLDIAETPNAVTVPNGLPGLLETLANQFGGALALVSGRTLTGIDGLFAAPGLPAAGQHGAEIRLPGGTLETPASESADLAALLPEIEAFVAAHPGLLVEKKGRTIAVHYRLAPRYQDEIATFLDRQVRDHAEQIETISGHRVFEIKPKAFNKGTAVARFMQAAPFAGRCPVFIGDDRTDEDGFAAVRALGGHAVRVGMDESSIADTRVSTPAELRAWLALVSDALAASERTNRAR